MLILVQPFPVLPHEGILLLVDLGPMHGFLCE